MSRPSVTYINQLAYADVPYPTTLDPGDVLREPYPSVARAGCGLCCVCMMVEFLTGERLSVEACINLSIRAGANYYGTDMNRLGRAAAKRFNLEMEVSQSVETLELWLEAGGCAVIHAGREHGLFSDGGHYLFADGLSMEADWEGGGAAMKIWLLDPSFTEQKYERPDRRGRVELRDSHILAGAELVKEECAKRSPSFYLFKQRG